MKGFIESRKRDLFRLFTTTIGASHLRSIGFVINEEMQPIDGDVVYNWIVDVTKDEKNIIFKGFVNHRNNGGSEPEEIKVVKNQFSERELEDFLMYMRPLEYLALDAEPSQVFGKVFDFAILGCQECDEQKVNIALVGLIWSLIFMGETQTINKLRDGLYCCQNKIKLGQYKEAEDTLTELKKSFDGIFKRVHFYLKDYPDLDSAYRACVDAAEGRNVIRDYKKKSFFYNLIT